MALLAVALFAGVALFGVVAATSSLDFLEERAALQDYDTQRFGAQASGLEVAVEHPLGIGPGQFERISELSAHSTYVRSLAEEGLLGAAVILCLVLLTLGFAARNVVLGVDTYGIGSAGLLAAWCGLLANSFFVDTLALASPLARRSPDLGRDRAPRRLPGEVGVRRGPRTDDHDSEGFHLQAFEQLPEIERRLGRLAVWAADDEDAVDPLREHLAVDQPEERRPVEQDVVVLRFLDLLEEAVDERRSRAAVPDPRGVRPLASTCRGPAPDRAALSWKMSLLPPFRAPTSTSDRPGVCSTSNSSCSFGQRMSAETSHVRCIAWESTRPRAAVTSVLPSPWSALVTSTVRWDVAGRRRRREA